MLANNHVLDWGLSGLLETFDTLKAAGIKTAGAGTSFAEAAAPAIVELSPACRVCVYGLGCASSGIPLHWAAERHRPGVRLLPDVSKRTAARIAAEVIAQRRAGDICILSIHWGSNWGYGVPGEQRTFARALIDLGACDILHGHSSHHPRAIEVHRGKLILYGCGDFINDYEGIRGHEAYRGDLSVMYLPRLNIADATLQSLTLIPFQMRRFRLQHASVDDAKWLHTVLTRESRQFATRFSLREDCLLEMEWR